MAEKKAGVTSVVIISKEYKKEKGFRKLSHKHSESAIRFGYAALFCEKAFTRDAPKSIAGGPVPE